MKLSKYKTGQRRPMQRQMPRAYSGCFCLSSAAYDSSKVYFAFYIGEREREIGNFQLINTHDWKQRVMIEGDKMRSGAVAAAVLDLLLILATTAPFCFGANVTYDHRGLIIGGRRRVLISGSIHYMRSTPEVSISEFFTHTHTQVN